LYVQYMYSFIMLKDCVIMVIMSFIHFFFVYKYSVLRYFLETLFLKYTFLPLGVENIKKKNVHTPMREHAVLSNLLQP